MGLASSCQGDLQEQETYAKVEQQGNKLIVKVDSQTKENSLDYSLQQSQQQPQQFVQKLPEKYHLQPSNKYSQNSSIAPTRVSKQSDQHIYYINSHQNSIHENLQQQSKYSKYEEYQSSGTQVYKRGHEVYTHDNNNDIILQNKKSMVENYQGQHDFLMPSQRQENIISSQIFTYSSDNNNIHQQSRDNQSNQLGDLSQQDLSMKNSNYGSSFHQYLNEVEQYEKDLPYYAKEQYEDGSVYEGYKLNGKRHGHGTFKYSQGGRYIGDWKENRICGHGTLFYPNEEKAYEGEWLDDQFHGQGIVYNEIQSQQNSSSRFDYSNFDALDQNWVKYDGEFRKDFKDGLGTLYLNNNEKYEGKFSFDYVHGKGSYYTRDGEIIYGEWQVNRLVENFQKKMV